MNGLSLLSLLLLSLLRMMLFNSSLGRHIMFDPVSITYFVIAFECGGCNFGIGKEVAAG